MRRTLLPAVICFCLSAVLSSALAQSPATQPTTQASDEFAADSPMRVGFKQLADPDPKIRDKARIDLMGIGAEDLPKLRQLVIENQPVSPAQAGALHDIVMQSFLAHDPYKVDGGETDASGTGDSYFLGLFWPVPDDDQARLGVAVDVRLPGFPSYRLLRKGDMILGILFDPDAPLLQLPNAETHTQRSIREAILARPGTQKVVLQVLRDGETIRVEVKMAPRPVFADAMEINVFNSERVDRADAYWEENFVPLLEPEIDASNLAEGP